MPMTFRFGAVGLALLGAALFPRRVTAIAQYSVRFDSDRKLNARRKLQPLETQQVDKPLDFLHIPKTGGTLIEDKGMLQNITWGRKHWNGNQQGMPDGSYCSNHHIPPWLLTGKDNVAIYTKTEVFCIVRHPYDRIVSEYGYRLVVGGVPDFFFNRTDCTAAGLNFFTQQALLAYAGGRRFAFDCHLLPQYDYVFDPEGRRWCHHVIRNENLTTSFNELMETKHVPVHLDNSHDFSFSSKCPSLSSADLDTTTTMMLDAVYAKDMEVFNYLSTTQSPDGNLTGVAKEVYEKKASFWHTGTYDNNSAVAKANGIDMKLLWELAAIKERR